MSRTVIPDLKRPGFGGGCFLPAWCRELIVGEVEQVVNGDGFVAAGVQATEPDTDAGAGAVRTPLLGEVTLLTRCRRRQFGFAAAGRQ